MSTCTSCGCKFNDVGLRSQAMCSFCAPGTRDTKRRYGAPPHVVGVFEAECGEFMFFQDMPIKLPGSRLTAYEHRLKPFAGLIDAAVCDFMNSFGVAQYVHSHVYLCAKHLVQTIGAPFNRPGYHCDGFLTDDINYVWSNCDATVFNCHPLEMPLDDAKALEAMTMLYETQADYTYPDRTLLRLDQFVMHRVALPKHTHVRTFFKLTVSADKFDLEGNSHNPFLDYKWHMRPRAIQRNTPQQLKARSMTPISQQTDAEAPHGRNPVTGKPLSAPAPVPQWFKILNPNNDGKDGTRGGEGA